ncbi:MAG: MBL fold metallo-hydrolase [Burkholderiales bacterium]|nr:MBL fold metallo-hydrolase [Burkholderiales bacterium]
MRPSVESFYDPVTGTGTHIVYDEAGGHAAVIDPVLDYDPKSGRTKSHNADKVLAFLREKKLTLDWILETHAHADHLSSAQYLRKQAGGKIGIGAHINQVQTVFKTIFHLEPEFSTDGSQFDMLFEDKQIFRIGKLEASALSVPGHTPADVAYQIGDVVFIGDTLFMPDVGTARCDFPGGNAHHLYQSIQRLLSLPPETLLYLCHDYPPAGREACLVTDVATQRAENIHVHEGVDEEAFVSMRQKRDAGLEMPVLLLPAIQINIRAGDFPDAETNGIRYLKIPLNSL